MNTKKVHGRFVVIDYDGKVADYGSDYEIINDGGKYIHPLTVKPLFLMEETTVHFFDGIEWVKMDHVFVDYNTCQETTIHVSSDTGDIQIIEKGDRFEPTTRVYIQGKMFKRVVNRNIRKRVEDFVVLNVYLPHVPAGFFSFEENITASTSDDLKIGMEVEI